MTTFPNDNMSQLTSQKEKETKNDGNSHFRVKTDNAKNIIQILKTMNFRDVSIEFFLFFLSPILLHLILLIPQLLLDWVNIHKTTHSISPYLCNALQIQPQKLV